MSFTTPLRLQEYEGHPNEWVVLSPLVWEWDVPVTVPRGFITDLASIPQALRNTFSVNGRSRKAAVLHDYLYCTQMLPRAQCDALFKLALAMCDAGPIERNAMWLAVRAGGWLYFNKRRDGLRRDFDFVPESYWSKQP